jgi:hypothetical protein
VGAVLPYTAEVTPVTAAKVSDLRRQLSATVHLV